MTTNDYVIEIIRKVRPDAKFVACKHSDDFIAKEAGLKEGGFFYVSLYDEKIDSNVIKTRKGIILISNSYLASFAYNLFLCRLYYIDRSFEDAELTVLLKHNFKKFFAEQLLHFNNNIFSRSIFLETLLYEQKCMVPVFEAKKQNSRLNDMATQGSNIMANLVMFHEFGHFMLQQTPGLWHELLQEYHAVLPNLFASVVEKYPAGFVTEFQCDVIAVISTLQQHANELGKEHCLRTIVFAYCSFAVMSSLTKSAFATAGEHRKMPDFVDFNSIEKTNRDYIYQLGRDIDLLERAKLVIDFCEQIANKENLQLFGNNGIFHLEENMPELLMKYIDLVMENDDQNAREMSLLVAEGFHEHPEGINFLYLRSKTFTNPSSINIK